MTQRFRLKRGGRIDRARRLRFTFNGKAYEGCHGDTLASALLANGIDVVGRSFKYGRPRGIVGAGAEEPNAIMQVGSGAHTLPNLRATQVELYDGLQATSVSGWPSVNVDVKAIAGWFGKLMPPGFYYKTFMSPAALWPKYEHFLRKTAGLGKSPVEPDPDQYDHVHRHCDVLVIGAGPAGLAAASDAAGSGAKVILVDEQTELGGSLLALPAKEIGEELSNQIDALVANDAVTLLPRSTAIGYYDHNLVAVVERCTDHLGIANVGQVRQRLHRIRASQVVLATGAIERPLVFANNDRPGIMLASAVSTYINRFGVAPGERAVVFTTNDHAYRTALDLLDAGRSVAAVVDTRPESNGEWVNAVRDRGVRIINSSAVIDVAGKTRVKSAVIATLNATGDQLMGATARLDCDLVAVSGGWSPVVHLSSHTGGKPRWDEQKIAFVPDRVPQGMRCSGACNGDFDNGNAQALFQVPHTRPTSSAPKKFVDLQLDVTADAIELAATEGYESVEHVKRYTAMGFGTDQGKLGNINGMAILAKALGQSLAETGTTVFRPAYTPTTFGALAGRVSQELFEPIRYTAMHRWHEQQGAAFENVGQWKRPWYYPRAGESMHDAVNRECLAVRNSVGMLDASTLGKIDIQGPDAAEFLNRVYTNAWLKLAPGKCRYGIMLREDGMVFDDGVTACLGENHYLMHTTTGNAAAVLSWLELWQQTEWPELDVYFNSVTDHWATVTVSGPNSRRVVEKICDGIDFSREAFGFMDWREGTASGVPARVFRISFTGELSFEINVNANYGRHVWEQVYAAGEEYGITPYGTETMHVLRAEKGFIIVGQDTDGSLTPQDAGVGWAVKPGKAYSFLGERSLLRADCTRPGRKQLIGLKPMDENTTLPEGAQIVNDPDEPLPMTMQGHVTSSYYSAVLGRSFALAVLKNGFERIGETVYCPLADGSVIEAEVTTPVFYDPKGERQHVE